jgi:hypothetical protein
VQGFEELNAHPPLAICPVCGETFDPSRYQVLVAALDTAAFDRIECADEALAARKRKERPPRLRRRSFRVEVRR